MTSIRDVYLSTHDSIKRDRPSSAPRPVTRPLLTGDGVDIDSTAFGNGANDGGARGV